MRLMPSVNNLLKEMILVGQKWCRNLHQFRLWHRTGDHKLQRAFSCLSSSKHGTSLTSSSTNEENIDQLEMLLEAYFVFIDNTLNKLLSSLPRSISDATFGRMSSLLNSMSVLSPREDVKGPISRQNSSSDLISRDMDGSLKPRRVASTSSDMGSISSQASSASAV